MGTPQWVRFSAIPRSIERVCKEDLAGIFSTFSFRLSDIQELGINEETQAIGTIYAPFIDCDGIGKAIELSRNWRGVVLSFDVDDVQDNISINLWPEQNSTNICLHIDGTIMWYSEDDYEHGDWLLQFLLQFTSALQADCCGYGADPDYCFVYEPLDLGKVVSRIRDGSLFHLPIPSIHMLASHLISTDEVNELIHQHGSYFGFRYCLSTAGYHMFWNFGGE